MEIIEVGGYETLDAWWDVEEAEGVPDELVGTDP